MKLWGVTEDGWYFRFLVPLLMWGAFGYWLAAITYLMAPTGKLVASAVMATALCTLMMVAVVFGFARNAPTLGSGVQIILSFAAFVVGTVLGVKRAREE